METKGKKRRGGGGQNVKLSKAMSYILRHGAKEAGIEISDDGYIKIIDLMENHSIKKFKPKLADILECVENNDKKRFQVKAEPSSEEITLENGYIRASQGHTMKGIDEEKLLKKITFPYKYSTIVHGTYSKVLELIQGQGLCRMARNHIHLAKGYAGEKGVISGMRGSCDIFIEVNLNKAIEDGVEFFESANGVVLTSGVDGYLPPKYFKSIKNKKQEFVYKAPLDFIVVFDFEAICDKDSNDKFEVQEIIEFPAVIIDCNEKKIVKGFQTYVKPTKYPELTEFCTELTGITQEQVDNGVSIETALFLFHEFLRKNNVLKSEYVLMSCGDYDAKALRREADYKKLFVPNYMKEWINIKKVFPLHLYNEEFKERGPIENIKKLKPLVNGMTDMLEKLNLSLIGRHHSGFDDSFNIARCAVKTMEDGYVYDLSHVASLDYTSTDEAANLFEQTFIDKYQGAEIPEIDIEAHIESLKKSESDE